MPGKHFHRRVESQETRGVYTGDIHTLPSLQACGPEQPTSFCVLSPAEAPPAVPGAQYVYRYPLSKLSMTSPPQPGSSSIFHNSSCLFHPIFMIFSNSKESVLLLLLHSRSVVSGSFATPWTVAHQAPPFMKFSRQEYWSA